jgi:hypothetical protein
VLCLDDAHAGFPPPAPGEPPGLAQARTELALQLRELQAQAEAAALAAAGQQGAGAPGGRGGGAAAAGATPRRGARPAWNAGYGQAPRRADAQAAAGGGAPTLSSPAPALQQPVFVLLVTGSPEALDASVARAAGAALALELPARETREEVITAQVRGAAAAQLRGPLHSKHPLD